jgi:hypothetical protein
MTRKHTPEELATAQRILAERKPHMEKMIGGIRDEEARWSKEIESLESRIHTEAIEINLGNGASIAIRTCLTGAEGKRLDELEKAQALESDADKREEMAAEMIDIVTLNPLINKKWILENKDKYSPSDILRVLLGFMEVRMQERTDRIKKIQSAAAFLPIQGRTELR